MSCLSLNISFSLCTTLELTTQRPPAHCRARAPPTRRALRPNSKVNFSDERHHLPAVLLVRQRALPRAPARPGLRENLAPLPASSPAAAAANGAGDAARASEPVPLPRAGADWRGVGGGPPPYCSPYRAPYCSFAQVGPRVCHALPRRARALVARREEPAREPRRPAGGRVRQRVVRRGRRRRARARSEALFVACQRRVASRATSRGARGLQGPDGPRRAGGARAGRGAREEGRARRARGGGGGG